MSSEALVSSAIGIALAFIPMYLISRLFRWLLGMINVRGAVSAVVAAVLTIGAAIVINAYGLADGGPPKYAQAVQNTMLVYGPIMGVILIVDLFFAARSSKAK